ncbi:MAG: hypothetical protein KF887_16540 [Paracoccaceae bacterium]|nr:MAG: hypothetical protein KF887_16540 [Paracoccaceae bacterium]
MKTVSILAVVVIAVAVALPARAERASPTVQCAAFWAGWVIVAKGSPFLPQDPADAALAHAFAAAARTEHPDEAARHLDRDTRDMARMIRAAIDGDRTSRDLMERLARGCEDAARARGLI